MKKNPHEEAARLRKVVALLAQIDRNVAFVGIPLSGDRILELVRSLTTADWRAIAREAKTHPPSKATIALVIEAIEARRPPLRKTTPVPAQLPLLDDSRRSA